MKNIPLDKSFNTLDEKISLNIALDALDEIRHHYMVQSDRAYAEWTKVFRYLCTKRNEIQPSSNCVNDYTTEEFSVELQKTTKNVATNLKKSIKDFADDLEKSLKKPPAPKKKGGWLDWLK